MAGSSSGVIAREPGVGAEIDLLLTAQALELAARGEFNPARIVDARGRTLAAVVRRRGQPAFRDILLEIYEGRCAISGCGVQEILEGAHIVPYQGDMTNDPRNGLLLRADLYGLFDLGLIGVDPSTMTIVVSSELGDSDYATFAGQRLRLPRRQELWPSRAAIQSHLEWGGLAHK